MHIKVLAVGSTPWQRLIRRWGVSFLVGEDVLFDTFGDPGVLLHNMKRFCVDQARIRHIVLSHDDWDHVSGLWRLLPQRQGITVYICPGFHREIKDKIASFGVRVVEVNPRSEIKENIFSTGQLSAPHAERCPAEQALVVKFLDRLTVITGCAHPGVVHTIRSVQQQFPKEKVHTVLGGFHLKDATVEEQRDVIRELKDTGLCKIGPMHCTGARATAMIQRAFGCGCMKIREGDSIEV